MMVGAALEAAEALAGEGIEAEVIDLRTLVPLDEQTILDSVAKTGHLVIADEGRLRCGVASEIAATVSEHGFESLKAPPARVARMDAPVPGNQIQEAYLAPSAEKIVGGGEAGRGRGRAPRLMPWPWPDGAPSGPDGRHRRDARLLVRRARPRGRASARRSSSPGYWLYAGGVPCVHVAERAAYTAHSERIGIAGRARARWTTWRSAREDYDGRGRAARARRHRRRPRTRCPGVMRQLFVEDPNGVKIEINVKEPS